MFEWSEEQRNGIVRALQERDAKLPCPRCGNNKFTLMDGLFNQPVQSKPGDIVLGGRAIPSIIIVCTRCGFMSQHALGALGLLPGGDNE
jgi:ribosomal protein S27AE